MEILSTALVRAESERRPEPGQQRLRYNLVSMKPEEEWLSES